MVFFYLIEIVLLLSVALAGSFFLSKANQTTDKYKTTLPEINKSSVEIAKHLLNNTITKDVDVVKFDGKKSNYYNSKYKAIKLSGEVYESNSMYAICLGAYLASQAILDFKGNLLIKTKWFYKPIITIVSFIQLPVLLICAILHSSNIIPNVIFTLNLAVLIAYAVSLIFVLLITPTRISTKKMALELLKKSNALSENELKIANDIINSIILKEFSMFTSLLFQFIFFAGPAKIYEKK